MHRRRTPRRAVARTLGAASAIALLAGCGAGATAAGGIASPTGHTTPSATGRIATVQPVSASATAEPETAEASTAVGALYAAGASEHSCTGTVVSTASGNAVLTAAHCVTGTGEGMTFVPALDGDKRPYGTWKVTKAFVTPAWIASQPPTDDFAVLLIEPGPTDADTPQPIQDVVGGIPLGPTAHDGDSVTVTAYNAGSDESVSCTTGTVWQTTAQGKSPAFACDGFSGGSSGSAWVTKIDGIDAIVGLIGGPYQGGCATTVSYSSRMRKLQDLLSDVETGAATPSNVPSAGASGC